MKKTTKKIDKIVTWVIIWTAVASMIWLSQTKKWKEITWEIKEKSKELWTEVKKKSSSFFSNVNQFYWKTFLTILKIFNKKNKKWEK